MNYIMLGRRNISFAFVFLTFFAIIFHIQINTPIHSDDYSYFFIGQDGLKRLYTHYVTWSGRILADITSSTMLYIFDKTAYSAINSIALIALIFLMAILPANISGRNLNSWDALRFTVLFLAYWVANTNLGQTTFWIVGAANYLWTNLYLLIYFNLLFFLARNINSRHHWFSICVFVLGFIAGCTNENIGIISFLFSVFAFYLRWSNCEKNNLTFFAFGATGSLVGWLVLILSPGNAIRSNNPAFSYWYSNTVSWRIDNHLFYRFPDMMDNYWQVFLVVIFILITSNLNDGTVNKKNNDLTKIALFFFFSSIVSALLMVGAPSVPPRAGNGTLVLLLTMLSLILNSQSLSSENAKKINFYTNILPILFLSIYFVPSYYLISRAYHAASNQEIVRGEVINLAKRNGKKNILIPNFNFSRLIKYVDRFDNFHNPRAMGKYWGVDSVNINEIPFNYGVIADEDSAIKVDKTLTGNMTLMRVFIYNSPTIPFFKDETHLTAELNFNPENLPKDKKIYIHLSGQGINEKNISRVKKYGFINADIGRSKGYLIGDKYYVDRIINDDITSRDIDEVSAGIFN